MTRKTYTAEYKTKLVLEAIREESRLEEIAAANEINPNMLRNWKQEFLKNASSVFSQKESKAAKRAEQKKEAALEKEKTKMLKKIGQLTLERDFLQDCFRACDLPIPNMINPKNKLSIRRQCELIHLNRSGVYYKHTENEKKREYEEELMKHIDELHTEYPCLGSRKFVTLLKGEHFSVGRKLVRRLMQAMGLYVVYPKPNLSKRDFRESIVPYLLRNKVVDFPNQVWSIDITYIPIGRGHMYLTAIIDWFSRKLMGWTLSDTLDTAPVLDTVKEAVGRYEVPAIINSDQGCQFTSGEYKNLLRQYGIRQSMDGKSRWADNIMIERWFRSLKTELIYINDYASPKELRGAIRDYVGQYNSIRPHQSLGYLTPDKVYGSSFGASA